MENYTQQKSCWCFWLIIQKKQQEEVRWLSVQPYPTCVRVRLFGSPRRRRVWAIHSPSDGSYLVTDFIPVRSDLILVGLSPTYVTETSLLLLVRSTAHELYNVTQLSIVDWDPTFARVNASMVLVTCPDYFGDKCTLFALIEITEQLTIRIAKQLNVPCDDVQCVYWPITPALDQDNPEAFWFAGTGKNNEGVNVLRLDVPSLLTPKIVITKNYFPANVRFGSGAVLPGSSRRLILSLIDKIYYNSPAPVLMNGNDIDVHTHNPTLRNPKLIATDDSLGCLIDGL